MAESTAVPSVPVAAAPPVGLAGVSVPIKSVNPVVSMPENTAHQLETTTAKDGNLLVNQVDGSPKPASSPAAAGDGAPLMITESDLGQDQPTLDGLAAQIEELAGEIQALETKIDRLTGNISVSPTSAASSDAVPLSSTPAVSKTPLNPPRTGSPIADIYNRVAEQGKITEEHHLSQVNTDEDVEEDRHHMLGTIGTILMVFGQITFVVLLLAPLFKETIGETVWNVLRTVGWLTALSTTGLGVLFSLFSAGRMAMKSLAIILLVLEIVMYLGVQGYSGLLGPLGGSLESLFSFYR